MGSIEVYVFAAGGHICHNGICPSRDGEPSRRTIRADFCRQSYGFICNCETVAAENVQPELLKTEKVAENTEKVKGKMSFTVLPGRKDSLYDALDGTVGKVTVTAPALKSDSARMKITGTTVVEGEGTVVRSGKPESRATYFYVKKKAYKQGRSL